MNLTLANVLMNLLALLVLYGTAYYVKCESNNSNGDNLTSLLQVKQVILSEVIGKSDNSNGDNLTGLLQVTEIDLPESLVEELHKIPKRGNLSIEDWLPVEQSMEPEVTEAVTFPTESIEGWVPVVKSMKPEITEPFTTSEVVMTVGHRRCIHQRDVLLLSSSQIQSFNVRAVKECWDYCKLTTDCGIFTFQHNKRLCSLYQGPMVDGDYTSNINLTVGNMECLECLGTIGDVVAQSEESGVRIVFSGKCLGVKGDKKAVRVDLENGEAGISLAWTNCSESNLWVLKWTKYEYTGSFLVQISLIGQDWSLEWGTQKGGLNIIYVAKTKNIPQNKSHVQDVIQQAMVVKRSNLTNKNNCNFMILGTDYFNYNDDDFPDFRPRTLSTNTNLYNETLSDIGFARPAPDVTCLLKKLAVRHGKVFNVDNVPFFLAGNTVTIKCEPGYGVEKLNYSSRQEVVCSKNLKLNPCKSIRKKFQARGNDDYCNIYIGLVIFLLVIFILTTIVVQLWSKNCIVNSFLKHNDID